MVKSLNNFKFSDFHMKLSLLNQAAPPLENDSKEMLDECRESEKPSDEDIQIFLDHRAPQTLNGKCLLACMYEKSGVVSGNIPNVLQFFFIFIFLFVQ